MFARVRFLRPVPGFGHPFCAVSDRQPSAQAVAPGDIETASLITRLSPFVCERQTFDDLWRHRMSANPPAACFVEQVYRRVREVDPHGLPMTTVERLLGLDNHRGTTDPTGDEGMVAHEFGRMDLTDDLRSASCDRGAAR